MQSSFQVNAIKQQMAGMLIGHLKMPPDRFEECWASGLFTVEHVRAVDEQMKELTKSISAQTTNPANSAGSLLSDEDGLRKQLNMGKL